MANILDNIEQQISGAAVQQVSQRLGVDPAIAQRAVEVAVPVIMSTLANKAQHADGAQTIHRESTAQAANQSAPGGTQVLGDQHAEVAQRMSDATGISRGDAGAILGAVAPAVLKGIGQHVQQQGINPGQLADVLTKATSQRPSV
jgi:hypothetical protein